MQRVRVEAAMAADELRQGVDHRVKIIRSRPGWVGLALILTFILFRKPKKYLLLDAI
jgi:hypothetical protein